MPSRSQRYIQEAQGVVDELDSVLSSEQRRLLCRGLQIAYDNDDASFIDDSDDDSENEHQHVRVRTHVYVQRPPPLAYIIIPLVVQALFSVFTIYAC